MKQVWSKPIFWSGLLKLATKIKKKKLALKSWNRMVFGQVDSMIKELDNQLSLLEERLKSEYTKEVEDEYLMTNN